MNIGVNNSWWNAPGAGGPGGVRAGGAVCVREASVLGVRAGRKKTNLIGAYFLY